MHISFSGQSNNVSPPPPPKKDPSFPSKTEKMGSRICSNCHKENPAEDASSFIIAMENAKRLIGFFIKQSVKNLKKQIFAIRLGILTVNRRVQNCR